MTKVLVLGATGMLGHKLAQTLSTRFEVSGTVRGETMLCRERIPFSHVQLLGGVVAEDFDSVLSAVESTQPQVVINCIGLIKHHTAAKDPLKSISINALFPRRLAELCRCARIRLIHLSTDCVFSGRQGAYSEADVPDAKDLYGRTKHLGEVEAPSCLTIRTSIIGRELNGSSGLIEWFLSRQGKAIQGYEKAIFSGFTTLALARIIGDLIEKHQGLDGLYHISAEPISKYDLLTLVKQIYSLDIQIEPDSTFCCDRSLNSDRFRCATGFQAPSWGQMIAQMHQDPTPYTEIRSYYAHR